jgi:hypothetical protein
VIRHPSPAYWAAVFREVMPEIFGGGKGRGDARAYAAANHTKWIWRGIYGE